MRSLAQGVCDPEPMLSPQVFETNVSLERACWNFRAVPGPGDRCQNITWTLSAQVSQDGASTPVASLDGSVLLDIPMPIWVSKCFCLLVLGFVVCRATDSFTVHAQAS